MVSSASWACTAAISPSSRPLFASTLGVARSLLLLPEQCVLPNDGDLHSVCGALCVLRDLLLAGLRLLRGACEAGPHLCVGACQGVHDAQVRAETQVQCACCTQAFVCVGVLLSDDLLSEAAATSASGCQPSAGVRVPLIRLSCPPGQAARACHQAFHDLVSDGGCVCSGSFDCSLC